jgi:hypothetical protein
VIFEVAFRRDAAGKAPGPGEAGKGGRAEMASTGRKAWGQNPRRNAQDILRLADFKAIAFPLNAPFV